MGVKTRQITRPIAFLVGGTGIGVANALDGDWGFVAFYGVLIVVVMAAAFAFDRLGWSGPDSPIWPSKDAADYR